MRKNKLGIFTISAFLVGLVISGQITSAQINQKETETAVTYTIGYLPITHALPVFEEKELLEAENSGIQNQASEVQLLVRSDRCLTCRKN